MTDDARQPTAWEHQRALEQLRTDLREGFAQANGRLDKLVTAEAFAAEQKRVDDRLKDLADDIAAERDQRSQAIADEKTARVAAGEHAQKQLDKLTTNIRWTAVSVVLPIALFLANIWFSRSGG